MAKPSDTHYRDLFAEAPQARLEPDPGVDWNRGHRDRLRHRFMSAGPAAVADYELLELVLFRAIERRDVKPLAKRLLARFGDFGHTLSASPAQIKTVPGAGPKVVHVPVYPREVVKRALDLNASALILVHNHPSGDPTPSQADVDMTLRLIDALEAVSVMLHDHVVVGKGREASLRALGHI